MLITSMRYFLYGRDDQVLAKFAGSVFLFWMQAVFHRFAQNINAYISNSREVTKIVRNG